MPQFPRVDYYSATVNIIYMSYFIEFRTSHKFSVSSM